jgi:hypothetical protein
MIQWMRLWMHFSTDNAAQTDGSTTENFSTTM